MTWRPPFPTVKLPDCQQNFDDLQKFLASRPKVLAGRVNADGTIAGGSGFSVSHPSTGAYTITIDDNDFGLVSMVATINQAINNPTIYTGWVSETSFSVGTFVPGTNTNMAFSFVAVGS